MQHINTIVSKFCPSQTFIVFLLQLKIVEICNFNCILLAFGQNILYIPYIWGQFTSFFSSFLL